MEHAIEDQLGLHDLKILRSNRLESDHGPLFVKYGDEELVRGEFESLRAIRATGAIACPEPFGVVRNGATSALITSFIDFRHGKNWAEMGAQLAQMHARNAQLLATKNSNFVSDSPDGFPEMATEKFGFPVPTCCGRLPQNNEWIDNWAEFFVQHRLKPQIDRLIEHTGDRQLVDSASALYRQSEKLLSERSKIVPSLVHGDLWGGNWSMAENSDGHVAPVIFDPSASYSDPEFEFGIMSMFGGWTSDFEREYDKVMGESDKKGKEQRVALYELYHNLNHWNHFGGSYRNSSMSLMRSIIC